LCTFKIFKIFDADLGSGIQDGKNSDKGYRMEKIRIRDKHLGPATLDSFIFDGIPLIQIRWILLGAHELRARRTMCKSFFFHKDINC
jgi:hypothetical protein